MLVKALEHYPKLVKCSLNDHFVFRAAVSVIFFYRQHIPAEIITKALQHVLKDFSIFAGVLIKHEHQLYIDCNNQGVQVNIVHTEKFLFQEQPDFTNILWDGPGRLPDSSATEQLNNRPRKSLGYTTRNEIFYQN